MNQLPGANPAKTNSSASAPHSSKKAENACENDASEFSSKMKKKDKNSKGEDNSKKTMEKSPDELLRSLKTDQAQALTGMEKTGETTLIKGGIDNIQKTNASEAVDRINKIVDRIMVAEAGATKEVKVSFNQDFLAGTEMLIKKEAGKLSVEFSTSSAESFNFLSRGEQGLVNQLQSKLGNEVSVNINMQQSDMGQQEQDGRSRNQFFGDEAQDSDNDKN